MSRIASVLNQVHGRLGMYLGSNSRTKLAAFLRGYEHALAEFGEPDPFLAEFRDWIHARYQTACRSWEDAILDHSKDDLHAVELFWKLVDEFLTARSEAEAANGPAGHKKSESLV